MTVTEPNKDWILDNIRNVIAQKGIKLESLSTSIGITQGELSKILNGERKDYFKHLSSIAKELHVSVHYLVMPQNGNVYSNYGNITDYGVGQALNKEHNDESIKMLLNEKDLVIESKNELISLLRADMENLKRVVSH